MRIDIGTVFLPEELVWIILGLSSSVLYITMGFVVGAIVDKKINNNSPEGVLVGIFWPIAVLLWLIWNTIFLPGRIVYYFMTKK